MVMRGRFFLYIILVVVIGVLGFTAGTLYGTRSGVPSLVTSTVGVAPPNDVDFSSLWKAWEIVEERYAGAGEHPSDEELVFGAISGFVDALGDPYSTFLPPQDLVSFEEGLSGNFGGVGMEIGMRDGVLTVISPLPNTPAERAGIRAGDQIIRIDDEPASGFSIDQAVGEIRGEVGTPVDLTVVRGGVADSFGVTVIRDTIVIPVVDTESRADGVFVVRLFSFTGSANNEFRSALREFILTGSDKLVLDLRGNPGGFLSSAVDVSSWFLPSGKVVVSEANSSSGDNSVFRSRGYDVFNEQLKMVILVNGGSASASEIVAGALQEHGIAQLVGTQTFGKGSVQELIDVTGDTSLKITTAQWLTPSGTSISNGGLTPDVVVEIAEGDIDAGIDTQLERAAEILLSQ